MADRETKMRKVLETSRMPCTETHLPPLVFMSLVLFRPAVVRVHTGASKDKLISLPQAKRVFNRELLCQPSISALHDDFVCTIPAIGCKKTPGRGFSTRKQPVLEAN